MFGSLGLTISGLVFLSLIAVFYFTKKRYHNLENDIFRVLIITTLVLLLLEFICVFTMATRDFYQFFNELLCRIYVLGVIVWIGIILVYLWTLGKKITYERNIEIFKEKNVIFCMAFGILAFIISCFFKLTFTTGVNENFYVIAGPGVYVLYVLFVVLNGYMFYNLVKNKNDNSFFKRLPIFLFLLFFFILFFLQLIFTDINDLTYLFAFCVISIYFTLENPDIKLVDELEEQNKKAEIANKEKNDFLARMSHEIRTPLNSIMGFSESIITNDNLTEAVLKEDAKNINLAGINLLEIIDNILDISIIESGKEQVNNKEYSIKDIIYELVSYTDSKLIDGEVNFIVDIDKELPKTLIGDKLILFRILQGLINNAVKFTKSGQIKLTINSKKEDNKVNLVFDISDTGIGIKEEDYDKLFSKFAKLSQDNEIDNTNSTGLGLAIVKELVELLNGKIDFTSTYGVGTTFHVELVNEYKDNNILGDFEIIKKNNVIVNDYSNYKVLIVDDNDVNIQILSDLLDIYNIKIDKCKSGLEAINNIKNNKNYDLIFIDYIMPEMDGIETLSILKRLSGYTIPKVIATANNNTNEERDLCLKEGFSDYLKKPIDNKSLRKILFKYFNKEGDK